MPVPVTVNLSVEIDASGSLTVFGQDAPIITNKVVCATTLPVRALYDASGSSNNGVLNSFFEFWEPSDAIGTRKATLAGKDGQEASEGRDYTKLQKKLVMDLQSILDGEMDASGAIPFTGYTSNVNYYTPNNFGRLALSSYAHYLFGHVAATAAITNDQAFMDAMLSKVNGSYKFASTNDVTDPAQTDSGSNSDANLAMRLVKSIVTKDDTAILAIVEQVLGQDASRALNQDNNSLAPDVRQELMFMENDIIYINIRLKRPAVVVTNVSQQSAPAATLFPSDESDDVNYCLEITLKEKDGASF
jgi:hypothetical protein